MTLQPDQLPESLSTAAFAPFLVASIIMAAAYGSSFLLSEHLHSYGLGSAAAGSVISTGIVTTILCCGLAGLAAQRFGVMQTTVLAAISMAISMLCFASVAIDLRAAYLGGLMLGVGWSVFFILAPLQIIHHLRPSARIQNLTIVSGAQMTGLGLASPLGHLVAQHTGSFTFVYVGFAVACVFAALCINISHRATLGKPHLHMHKVAIMPSDVLALLRKKTVFPIAMIVLAACSFSGLSTYQTIYAESRFLPPDTFFLAFTFTSVVLRFSLARTIGRLHVERLALMLFLLTLAALIVFILNPGNLALYILSTVLFATGYGLSYSTLNGMAVNFAENQGASMSATSQVFTLAYFVGLFGFPYIGGSLIRFFGINAMFLLLLCTVLANIALLGAMRVRTTVPVPN